MFLISKFRKLKSCLWVVDSTLGWTVLLHSKVNLGVSTATSVFFVLISEFPSLFPTFRQTEEMDRREGQTAGYANRQ